MVKAVCISIFLGFAGIATAIEITPYPQASITAEEWQAYYDEVTSKLADSGRAYEKERLEVFSDDELRANFAFTMPGHPAHPSWVTRYVGFRGDELYISAVGYFAGDEEAFKVLFGQYQEMVEETRRRFAR